MECAKEAIACAAVEEAMEVRLVMPALAPLTSLGYLAATIVGNVLGEREIALEYWLKEKEKGNV